MDGTRVIRNPHWGNAVVGTLLDVDAEGAVVVRLDTDEDADDAMWWGTISQGWVMDAMLLVGRRIVVCDKQIYLAREV